MQQTDFEKNLGKYAEVIVKVGLNLQPGQRLLIGASAFGNTGAPVEAISLVRAVALQAYQAGARYVDVIWNDAQLNLIRFQHAPRDSFEELSTWKADATYAYGERGDAILIIYADDPDLLSAQDPELIAMTQRAGFQYFKKVASLIERSATNWLVVGAPVPGWSSKVLPHVPPQEREARMWDTIFEMCRVKQDDPVAGWQAHIRQLEARSDFLNSRRYTALKYSAPGTDLSVGLPQDHLWLSGGLTSQNGIFFTANVPTEEVFTLPHRAKTEGVITATKPLSVGGTLIENFCLTFEAGRVVNAVAEKGETHLRRLLETDEGAARIGEVALVPHSSPISQSGLLFYNILFDENASNHIALGNAYRFSMEGGEALSGEAFAAAGGNQSLIHVDFMVGSGEMNVDGLAGSGGVEPIMRGGEWAFDV